MPSAIKTPGTPAAHTVSQSTLKLGKTLEGQTGKAIANYRMIEAGDTVLVCVSGGKDSHTLLHVLMALQKRAPLDFRLIAMNLDQKQPGFPTKVLPEYFERLDIEYHIVESDTYSIVKKKIPTGKTTCSLCSRLRRGLIYRTAKTLGANKIALGHHRDDMVHTLFLNLLFGGKLKAMPPKLLTDDGAHIVIRPLAYCSEGDIARFARGMGFPVIPCNICGTQENLQRQKIREMMLEWEQRFPGRSTAAFSALQNVIPSHLADSRLFDFADLQTTVEQTTPSAPSVPRKRTEEHVAVVFADIVGSTGLYLEFGDNAAYEAIAGNKQCMIDVAAKYSGQLVKTLGDGVILVFSETDEAVQASIAMQRSLHDMPPSETGRLDLKVSIHYGSVLREGRDIYGDTVNLAAHLLEEARSGQILTSLQTLLRCSRDYRALGKDLGNILLKGRAEDVNFFEIPWQKHALSRKKRPSQKSGKSGQPLFSFDTSNALVKILVLSWDGKERRVDADHPVLSLGSAPACDICIAGSSIALNHARIELRPEGYFLIDHSDTGTLLSQTGEMASIYLRYEETLLRQDGCLYLGDMPPAESSCGIHFKIMSE